MKFRRGLKKKHKKGPPGPPVYWIPARATNFKKRIQDAIKKSGLSEHIQVKERAGRSLKSVLCRSALKPRKCAFARVCALCKNNPGNGICTTADALYVATCSICHEEYLGESKNPLGIRYRGHNSDIKATLKGKHRCIQSKDDKFQSALAQHVHEKHLPKGEVPKFALKLAQKTNGSTHRKIAEGVKCKRGMARKQYAINRRIEGNGIVNLHW